VQSVVGGGQSWISQLHVPSASAMQRPVAPPADPSAHTYDASLGSGAPHRAAAQSLSPLESPAVVDSTHAAKHSAQIPSKTTDHAVFVSRCCITLLLVEALSFQASFVVASIRPCSERAHVIKKNRTRERVLVSAACFASQRASSSLRRR